MSITQRFLGKLGWVCSAHEVRWGRTCLVPVGQYRWWTFMTCPYLLLQNSSGIVGATCRVEQVALELPALHLIYVPLTHSPLIFSLQRSIFFLLNSWTPSLHPAAKSFGWFETQLYQAVLQHCGGPRQSEEGDLPSCEEKPGSGSCQWCLHNYALQVSFVHISKAASWFIRLFPIHPKFTR